jgi:cytochrome c oxidase subunit 2
MEFDRFNKPTSSLLVGDSRMLDVDSRLVLPNQILIRFCVTSSDVIHSWTLNGAGVKIDAVPGLLNTATRSFPIIGTYYGQCSEICGANHSFIPIVVEITNWENFFYWLSIKS